MRKCFRFQALLKDKLKNLIKPFNLNPIKAGDCAPHAGFFPVVTKRFMTTFHDRIGVINSCDFPRCSAKDEDWD